MGNLVEATEDRGHFGGTVLKNNCRNSIQAQRFFGIKLVKILHDFEFNLKQGIHNRNNRYKVRSAGGFILEMLAKSFANRLAGPLEVDIIKLKGYEKRFYRNFNKCLYK